MTLLITYLLSPPPLQVRALKKLPQGIHIHISLYIFIYIYFGFRVLLGWVYPGRNMGLSK